ncbi:MAG TPA: YcgN family cysteine cluster protein [Gammaproteobacteria bacterium]|nr:YcgN family cysteine cluster protein [Gammaproteobacteria bacterium]
MPLADNFWQKKSLAQMTAEEWESLCDGCGRCCLLKLEYEDTGEVDNTSVACRLLDIETCRCSDYARRREKVPECVQVTPGNVASLYWLPESCAYRRLYQGEPLPEWHYLVCGDRNAVHEAGVSVKWFAMSEDYIHPEQLADFVIDENEE